MNLLEFNKQFPTEESCTDYFIKLRLNRGLTCSKCQTQTRHYYLKSVRMFRCKECHTRLGIYSGTMLMDTKLPLMTWFMTIHLMTSIKKSFSCLELQRQLGMNRYETIQNLMRKIRSNMGQRETKYKLSGEVELDHGMYEIVDLDLDKDEFGNPVPLKRGSGSQRQLPVLVMCESRERPQTKGRRINRELGFVKMIVMDDMKSEGVNYEISKHVNPKSHIISDNSTSYVGIKNVVDKHTSETLKGKEGVKRLPWVHTVISNSKKQLLGVHHSVRKQYLQTYLDEFCYKLNRRGFETDLFDRMLVSGLVKTDNGRFKKLEKRINKLDLKKLKMRIREEYLKGLFRPGSR